MEILQLVDQLEQVLNRGWRMPLTASLVVNEEECLRLIDQMRISVPSAIKESERMIAERDRIMAEARSRAETMLDQAEDEAMKLVSQHFVTQEAHREADRIVAAGREDAMRMVQEAEDYALNVLRDLVNKLGSSVRQAENGIEAIEETRRRAGLSPSGDPLDIAAAPPPAAPSVAAPPTLPTSISASVTPAKPPKGKKAADKPVPPTAETKPAGDTPTKDVPTDDAETSSP
ncbi:hypothetical protein GC175_21510 [bacterium]|nr:hypothetical protein [bacterium]